MIAVSMLRERWVSLLGTFLTLVVAVGMLAATATLLLSAQPRVPDRYSASPVLVHSPAVTVPESFVDSRPWTDQHAVEVAARLAALPGVTAAVPDHAFYAQAVIDGQPVGDPAPGSRDGHGWSAAALGGYQLTAGAAPQDGEVVVDQALGLAPGAAMTLLTATGTERMTVSGTVDGPGIYLSDSQAAARAPGVRVIGLLTRPDADLETIARAAQTAGTVVTGEQRAQLEPAADARTRWIGNQVLTALAGLAAFISIFIVASTFAFAAMQRRREFGLLRAVGATVRQLRRMMYAEVLALGSIAGVLGAALGALAAGPLGRWLVDVGFEPAGFQARPGVVALGGAFVAGLIVALAGAGAAARRAARVSPLEALREAAAEPKPMTRIRWIAGLAALALGAGMALAAAAASGPDMGAYALYAAMGLTVGLTLLLPVLLTPVIRLVTWPLQRGRGATGLLVRQNALTAVRRTSATAAPVLLSVAFAVLVAGMVQTTTASYGVQKTVAAGAAAVAVPEGVPGLSDEAVQVMGGLSALPTTLYRADGTPLSAVGIGAPERRQLFGSTVDLDAPGAAAVDTWAASQYGWQVGDELPVMFENGQSVRLRIAAIVDASVPAGVLLSREAVRAAAPSALTDLVYLPSARPASAGLGARVLSAADYAASTQSDDDRLVWVFTVLLISVSAGFGVLSVANTNTMAAAGRRSDITVLRLAGATRRQIYGQLAAETSIVVAAGTALGLGVAVAALAALASGLSEQAGGTVPLTVPWAMLGGLFVGCLVLSIGSTLLPART